MKKLAIFQFISHGKPQFGPPSRESLAVRYHKNSLPSEHTPPTRCPGYLKFLLGAGKTADKATYLLSFQCLLGEKP